MGWELVGQRLGTGEREPLAMVNWAKTTPTEFWQFC